MKLPISLCVFVKNEEHCIRHMLDSVKDYVSEIIIVDTGSWDGTVSIAKEYTNKVHEIEFTDFGQVRTITGHFATQPWVLMLDADETLHNPAYLLELIKMDCEAFGIPRKRWLDLKMQNQTELEAYPDLQVRFYKNNKDYRWERELHEYFDGAAVWNLDDTHNIYINHFQDVFKDSDAQRIRDKLYKRLAQKAKVTIVGGHEIEE